jgi:Heparinase II/III-like protein/Heparinase II/III N-terminus
VSLAWREKLSRATSLSWDEVYTRIRQELVKRLDVGLYRFGLQPEPINLGTTDARRYFFFSRTDLPERVRLLREHLPTEVSSILGEADEICRHHFRLLGYVDLDYGAEIDWHLDAAHGKRSLRKPWYRIDFLNFAEVGDHKVIWELSRHQHLVTLAKAWLLTHDDRYANEVTSQWYAWQRANPYPIGINWVSSLEIAFRSLSWIWVRHLLADCPALDPQFNTDLLSGLALNGRHIERYLSTYFSPNTHLLGEALALFFIGVLCPQIPAASRWREKGLEILLQEPGRQVHPDGVYFEQSLYYHVYSLDLFLHARLLASRNGIDVPSSFDQVVQRMLGVVHALSQSGSPHGFGDDDGGRVFNPRRNRSEHMTDPMAIGAIFFQNEKLRAIAPLTEEAIWLFGEQAASFFLPQVSTHVPIRSQSFPEGGIYVSANSGNCPQQIVIDAGPLGAMRGGHGHADALSVKYSAHGRPSLIDPGTFCYISSGNDRNSFRGSAAHNTLRVDEVDQAAPDGPFAWKELPSIRAESWITGETFTLFRGSHTGYLRLSDPVLHRRFVVHLYKTFWMVRDVAEGNAAHILETFWHLGPNLTVRAAGGRFIASQPNQSLAFVPVSAPEWNCQITSGRVSPVYGIAEPAGVLRCRAEIRLPADHAMVIRALATEHEDPGELVCVTAQSLSPPAPGATVYEYSENQRTHFLVFRDAAAKTWNFGDWASDAGFFYYCTEAQRISQLIACHVTFVTYRSEPLVSNSRRVERFEYWDGDGGRQVYSSDQEALIRFSDTTLASWDAGVVG